MTRALVAFMALIVLLLHLTFSQTRRECSALRVRQNEIIAQNRDILRNQAELFRLLGVIASEQKREADAFYLDAPKTKAKTKAKRKAK